MYKYRWYCRWCGATYRPKEQTDRDGFCSEAHKQAHYRAYRKYVTLQGRYQRPAAHQGVTPKGPRTGASTGTGKQKKR